MTRKTSGMFLAGLVLLSACSSSNPETGDNAVLPTDTGNSVDAVAGNTQAEDAIAPVDGNSALDNGSLDNISIGQDAEANGTATAGNAL